MCSPPTSRVLLAADQRRTSKVCQRRNLAVTQRGVDVLAAAGACSGNQRGHDSILCVQTRSQIGHRNTYFDRRAVTSTRDVHQAHLCLNHDIVARPVPVGTRLTVPSDACIDKSRVDFSQCLVVQSILLEASGEVVLNQNIAFFC